MQKARIEKTTIGQLQYAYSLTSQYDPSGPLLVFLHEGLGSIEMWKDFPFQVGENLKMDVLVFDRNGYGHSDPLVQPRKADYLHRAAYKELPAVLEKIAPNRKVILWGHSDGGTIALLNAAINDDCIAVVTEAAHVIVEDVTLDGISPAIKAFEAGKLKGLERFHGDKTETIFYAWAHTWLHASFADWDICREIKDVRVPVLSIQGEDDQYGSYRQLELIQEHTNGLCEIVEIQSCGHAPFKEQTEEVFKLGTTFIRNYVTT